ncbi:MAG: lysine transporter LysE [Pseudonocardiales bacterium]|nr:MAG: lysine transporter LysE [Pseudonocardiales bacterium]
MLPISNLLAFAIAAAVIVAIPGPSVLFTISRALTLGRRAALLTVVGNAVGVSAQVVTVAFGIGAVVERSIVAFTIVKYLGAAYIVYLGVQAVRHRRAFTDGLAQRAAPVTPLRAMRDGAIVGATNPKTIVVFVAVMPGFTDPAAGHLQWQLLLLGSVFPVIALLLDSVWALAAGTSRDWLARSPRRLAAIGGTGGLVMIGLGTSLAVTGRKD